MKYVRFVAVLAVTVLATVGLSACGSSAPKAAAAAFNTRWVEEALQVVRQVRTVSRARTLAPSTEVELEGLGRSVDEVIARAPRAEVRTPEAEAAFAELTLAQQFKAVLLDATLRPAEINLSADAVAGASTADPQLRRLLHRDGEEILLDAACDAAFSMMVPGERDEAEQSGFTRWVADTGVAPLEDAINNYSARQVASLFGPGALVLVSWFQYGKGIAEKADALRTGNAGVVVDPNANPGTRQVMTRAYVYYVKTCLVPPS